jgi:protein gp37
VSVSDQATADALIPELLRMPACVRGVSAEPLLGPIDVWRAVSWSGLSIGGQAGPHHIIVGGESGRNARLCDMAWIESLVSQCRVAGIPVFVKQLGARSVWLPGEGGFVDLGSKGQAWVAWPSVLKARMHVGDVWKS